MLYVAQFRKMVRETLQDVGLWHLAIENLLVGTALQESNLFYLEQFKGPAIGFYQIEPETYEWLREKIKNHALCRTILNKCNLASIPEGASCLAWHLKYATIVARFRYLVVPEEIPHASDIEGLGRYWKAHYNTNQGVGTVKQFIENYKKYNQNV